MNKLTALFDDLKAPSDFKEWKATHCKPETQIVSAADFVAERRTEPPQVIQGVLRAGQIGMMASASKSGKTWLLMALADAVAVGLKWMGWQTTPGNVLYLNGELPPYDLQIRQSSIASSLGLDGIPPNLDLWHLHGQNRTITSLIPEILRRQEERGAPYALILPDPLYCFGGGRDENDNAEQAKTMNELADLAEQTGAAIWVAHHFSKGNKSLTDHLDRASGAGMFARAVDTFMTLTPHNEEGCYTVETTCRSFAKPDKQVVRWEYPLWRIDENLDPEQLKRPTSRIGATARFSPEGLVALLPAEGLHHNKWLKLAKDTLGIGKSRFNELRKIAQAKKLVEVDGLGTYVKM